MDSEQKIMVRKSELKWINIYLNIYNEIREKKIKVKNFTFKKIKSSKNDDKKKTKNPKNLKNKNPKKRKAKKKIMSAYIVKKRKK